MGWNSEVYGHAGWVGDVVADGRVSTGSSNGLGVFVATPDGGREHLPWGQVVAWRAMCECGWTGPSVPAQNNEYGNRACPDEIVDSLMIPAWNEHVRPFEAVLELERVCAELDRLTGAAEDLVRAARGGGVSWVQIGRAAGLTRQGAQQRWGRVD